MYTLIAHGGDVAAGRRTAGYVYGDWTVTLPDGVDTEPTDAKVGQGFIARVNDKPKGRFDHTFVKEGASLDAASRTVDLEVVLDDAFSRTDGDVYFQHDITGDGLNGTMPERDYHVGDLVRVVRWGKAMVLPVTGTTLTTGDDGRVAGSTHVGGELIRDKRATKRLSDELRRTLARETSDAIRQGTSGLRNDVKSLRGDVTTVGRTADAAKRAAGNAQTSADSAASIANSARSTARSATSTAADAKRAADAALKAVDLATGDMGQYLDEVETMVEQARTQANRASEAAMEATTYYDGIGDYVRQATELAGDIDAKVTDAEASVRAVKQASEDLDPKIKRVTDLLAQSTSANTEAIRLNTEADQLRDRAIVDLTEAGKKLTKSQNSLTAATRLNTSSIENLKEAQKSHAQATRELGTAQQALAQAVENNSKVITAVSTSQAALKKAQDADRKAATQAVEAQKKVNAELRVFDRYLADYTTYVNASRPLDFFIDDGQEIVVTNNSPKYRVALDVSAHNRTLSRQPYIYVSNNSEYTVHLVCHANLADNSMSGGWTIYRDANWDVVIDPGDSYRLHGSGTLGNIYQGRGTVTIHGDYVPKLSDYK